ncbi:MAG: ABC transporter ATP-binding protein/permease, partial [Clostridiales bacterium]|nr:ABC transporter ATP-binding protein/permease [Clostridiales bacterium]
MRKSGIKLMASLTLLLGSLAYIMLLAVLNGALGFVSAIGATVFGAVGVAKLLGESVALSYAWIAVLAVACGLARGLLRYAEQYSNHFIAFKLLAVLRDKIFKALRVLCPAKLETKQKGSIIAMLTSDVETLEVFYAHTISPIFIAVLVNSGVFVFAGLIANWHVASAALCGYLAIGILLPLAASRAVKKHGVNYRREFASFNAYFLDSIKGVKDIVFNNAGRQRAQEVNRRSESLLKISRKLNVKSNSFMLLTQAAVSLAVVLVAGLCAYFVINGGLSAGRAVIALAAVFSSFGPVVALSNLPGSLAQTFASADRVLSLLKEKPQVTPVTGGVNFEFERLTVKDLVFGYGGGNGDGNGDGDGNGNGDGGGYVLNGVSLEAERGEIVGIVGESGCGKSTLLKLLMRFWDKGGGAILYNGADVTEINTDSLLENVTMVSQSTYLFAGTVEENLRIARPGATTGEIEDACKKASIHESIALLPEGYQTETGVLGDRFSAGEKQRIGLARAFLRQSPLILLDEPTSNIDSVNEGIILNALKEQKKGKAIILVSHRESTMAVAD